MSVVNCPECSASSEDDHVVLIERLVAFHPIRDLGAASVFYEEAVPQHTSWDTRQTTPKDMICFAVLCKRCEHEWSLPDHIFTAHEASYELPF